MNPDYKTVLANSAPPLQELLNIEGLLTSKWIYAAIFVLAACWVLTRLAKVPFQMLWRRGYDESRNLEFALNTINGIIYIGGLFYALRTIFGQSPVLSIILTVMIFSVILMSSFNLISNLASGISLLFSPEMKRGKRIELDNLTGVIRQRALLRTIILSDTGETVWIPNNQLTRKIVRFSDPMNAFPVRLFINVGKEGYEKLAHILNEITATSPFRKEGTFIEINPIADKNQLSLLFYTWSPNSIKEAKIHIVKALEKINLAEEPGPNGTRNGRRS
jgi:hypothetical protein